MFNLRLSSIPPTATVIHLQYADQKKKLRTFLELVKEFASSVEATLVRTETRQRWLPESHKGGLTLLTFMVYHLATLSTRRFCCCNPASHGNLFWKGPTQNNPDRQWHSIQQQYICIIWWWHCWTFTQNPEDFMYLSIVLDWHHNLLILRLKWLDATISTTLKVFCLWISHAFQLMIIEGKKGSLRRLEESSFILEVFKLTR